MPTLSTFFWPPLAVEISRSHVQETNQRMPACVGPIPKYSSSATFQRKLKRLYTPRKVDDIRVGRRVLACRASSLAWSESLAQAATLFISRCTTYFCLSSDMHQPLDRRRSKFLNALSI